MIRRPPILVACLITALSWLSAGCVSSVQPEVSLAEDIDEDSDYAPAFKDHTRDFEIIKNFETRYILHATRLTPQFLKAMSDRYQRLYNESQPTLEEAAGKTGFFVVLYTANHEMTDLDDDRLWSVQVEHGGTVHKASAIKRLSKKERWQPFFKKITPWSHEYLVLFDIPNSSGDPQLVSRQPIKMMVSNADGRVAISW